MSGSNNDVFDVLSGELTALRRSVEHYGGAGLSKNEARDLNKSLLKAVSRMEQAAQAAPTALVEAFAHDRARTIQKTREATTEAAERVLQDVRRELAEERLKFAQAAGEARREAWRWFGGFWVWLASVGAVGALLGALAMAWIGGTISARDFGDFPGVFCASAGGQVIEQNNGSSFCAVWIKPPPETGS